MMAAGALDEVRALAARNLNPSLPAMKAHGVPWLIRHLNGEITLAEAVEHAKLETRQYTKRQATWFRNQLPEFEWVAPADAQAAIERQLQALQGTIVKKFADYCVRITPGCRHSAGRTACLLRANNGSLILPYRIQPGPASPTMLTVAPRPIIN